MTERSALLQGLNPEQQAAVLAVKGPVLILAGAGSGKTRVITHRIAHLVLDRRAFRPGPGRHLHQQGGGGDEGAGRGPPGRRRPRELDLHLPRLLRARAAARGGGGRPARGFVIYDQDDQVAAVREALRALDLSEKLHPPRRILSRISARKNSGRAPRGAEARTPSESRPSPGSPSATGQTLDAARAVDFDDLLLRTLVPAPGKRLRSASPTGGASATCSWTSTRTRTRPSTRSSASSWAERGNLTVVGDEDQSIYSWRGADIQNILDFERDFPGARVLRLEQNYRSTQAILDAASALVAHNQRRKGKTLRAVRAAGGAGAPLHRGGRVRGGGLGRGRSRPSAAGAGGPRCSSA